MHRGRNAKVCAICKSEKSNTVLNRKRKSRWKKVLKKFDQNEADVLACWRRWFHLEREKLLSCTC